METKDAEILRAILRELDMPASQLAKIIDLGHPESLYRVKRGKGSLSLNTIRKILQRFPQLNGDYILMKRGEILLKNGISHQEYDELNRKYLVVLEDLTACHKRMAEVESEMSKMRKN